MEVTTNQLVVHFEHDSATTVSLETAHALMMKSGAPSLEALIQHALVKLKNDFEVLYPSDDGLSNSEHFPAIARRTSQRLKMREFSNLPGESPINQAFEASKLKLNTLLSDVTKANKHGPASFGQSVESKRSNIRLKPSQILALYRDEIRRMIEANGGANPKVFGSVMRGKDTIDSDLDLLIDAIDSTTSFSISDITSLIEDRFGIQVDVYTLDSLPKKFRDEIVKTAIPL